MDTIYPTSHHLYDSFLSILISAGIKDPSGYLPGPIIQICVWNSPQRGSRSFFPSMETPCYEAPWLWFVILLLLPWLFILSIRYLYKLVGKTIQKISSPRSNTIKVRVPGQQARSHLNPLPSGEIPRMRSILSCAQLSRRKISLTGKLGLLDILRHLFLSREYFEFILVLGPL